MSSITTALRALLALAVAALLAGTLLASAPSPASAASAGDEATTERQRAGCNWQRKQCWGAVAFNKATGKSGVRNDTRTKKAAVRGAMKKCRTREENEGLGSECVHPSQKKTYVRNGCLYVVMMTDATGAVTDWAKGTAYNPRRAKKRAMSKLDGNGTKSVSAFVCTTRHL